MVLPTIAQNKHAQKGETEKTMTGTIYANYFEGRKTSSGEIFKHSLYTAAHKTIKLGTYVLVTNVNNGKSVVVKINDRCPKRNVLDLTRSAAHAIGIRGSQKVSVRILTADEQADWVQSNTNMPDEEMGTQHAAKSGKINSHTTSVANDEDTPDDDYDFDILLCSVSTLRQAQIETKKLPIIYHDKVSMHPCSTGSTINLVLSLSLNKDESTKLLQALKADFPDSRLIQNKKKQHTTNYYTNPYHQHH